MISPFISDWTVLYRGCLFFSKVLFFFELIVNQLKSVVVTQNTTNNNH